MKDLTSPYPYFGGKRRVAGAIWQRFGDVPNFVEPCCGSGAVLLARPGYDAGRHTETVNDINGLLCNFWRALQADPEQVAYYADQPINETDLHARHAWLVARQPAITADLSNPEAYDAKAAGWWVWGIGCWIGSGWCPSDNRPSLSQQLPMIGANNDGGHSAQKGVHGKSLSRQLPMIGGTYEDGTTKGTGVHSITLARTNGLHEYLHRLAVRTRRVRVTCGDWRRILTPSVTTHHGTTAVMLDPPYALDGRAGVYSDEDASIWQQCRAWCLEHGDNPKLRIAFCGYGDADTMPASWEYMPWQAPGGYAGQSKPGGQGSKNKLREAVWFSPGCSSRQESML